MKLLCLALCMIGCASTPASDDTGDDDDGKADGVSSGTYFECEGLATNNAVYLDISKTKSSVVVTVEGSGVNKGKLQSSDSSSNTYSGWSTKVFFGTGDTLVVPDALASSGAGKVEWNIANVNPHWEGTCTKKAPTGDQCMPLLEQIYPVDSSATAKYATVSTGHYSVDIPSSSVGDFFYNVDMKTSGILCTDGAVTPTSCSAIVAEKIGSQAFADGSSSGQPYVSKRTKTSTGYSWTGGVHDEESGEFAYALTTDSDEDGCNVTSTTNESPQ
jgi:hypothetical protein